MAFEARLVVREAVKSAKPILDRVRSNREIWDQLMRGALSMTLNFNEAIGRTGLDRKNRYKIAEGSAREARAAIETAVDWEYVTEDEARASWILFDRCVAILYRLIHPKGGPR